MVVFVLGFRSFLGGRGSDLYSGLVKVFSDVQGIQVAVGSHVFDLTLVGLNLFENYLPTRCVFVLCVCCVGAASCENCGSMADAFPSCVHFELLWRQR